MHRIPQFRAGFDPPRMIQTTRPQFMATIYEGAPTKLTLQATHTLT